MAVILSLSAAEARPRRVTPERLAMDKLFPRRIAARMKGSRLVARELAGPGARHHLDAATLQMRVTPGFAVRGGVGVAHQLTRGFLPEEKALAMTGGATVTLWQGEDVQLDVDVSATRADYRGQPLSDTTILVALRNR